MLAVFELTQNVPFNKFLKQIMQLTFYEYVVAETASMSICIDGIVKFGKHC